MAEILLKGFLQRALSVFPFNWTAFKSLNVYLIFKKPGAPGWLSQGGMLLLISGL